MMGIEVYANESPSPLQRGYNHKSAKIGLGHSNIFLFMNHSTIKAQIYTSAS
jgi:hypothetical protein